MINGFDFYLNEKIIVSNRITESFLDNFAFHNLIDILDLLQTALFDNLTENEIENDFYFIIYYSNTAQKVNIIRIDNRYTFIFGNDYISYNNVDEYISLNF